MYTHIRNWGNNSQKKERKCITISTLSFIPPLRCLANGPMSRMPSSLGFRLPSNIRAGRAIPPLVLLQGLLSPSLVQGQAGILVLWYWFLILNHVFLSYVSERTRESLPSSNPRGGRAILMYILVSWTTNADDLKRSIHSESSAPFPLHLGFLNSASLCFIAISFIINFSDGDPSKSINYIG